MMHACFIYYVLCSCHSHSPVDVHGIHFIMILTSLVYGLECFLFFSSLNIVGLVYTNLF